MMLQLKEVLGRQLADLSLTKKMAACSPDASVEEVVKAMQTSAGGSVVLVEGGKPVGIFTERDVLKKVALSQTNLKTTKISTLMTKNPASVRRADKLGDVLNKMRTGKFRHMVVTDSYGNAESVISMRDLMDYLSELMMEHLDKKAA